MGPLKGVGLLVGLDGVGAQGSLPCPCERPDGSPPLAGQSQRIWGLLLGRKRASSFQCYLGPKQREAELSVEKQGRTLD